MISLAKRLDTILLAGLLPIFCAGRSAPPTQSSNVPAAPQAAPAARSDEPSSITLDLIALDKGGQPVTDLKADELHLFVDKQELKIVSLSPAINEPLLLGFFFDISGSRRSDRSIAEESRLANDLLHSLWRQGDSGFVAGFSNKMYFAARPTNSLMELDKGLKKIPEATYFGPTALYDSLCFLEPRKLAPIPGRKLYLVFSDFDDNTSKNKPEHAIEVAREAHICIFPLILSDAAFGHGYSMQNDKRAKEQARRLADETGGDVLIPDSGKQLPAIMQHLADELKAAYRLTYAPSAAPAQNARKRAKMRIETTRPQVKLLYPKI